MGREVVKGIDCVVWLFFTGPAVAEIYIPVDPSIPMQLLKYQQRINHTFVFDFETIDYESEYNEEIFEVIQLHI
jgi:hypothetical protein